MRFGPLALGDLAEGASRRLDASELAALVAATFPINLVGIPAEGRRVLEV